MTSSFKRVIFLSDILSVNQIYLITSSETYGDFGIRFVKLDFAGKEYWSIGDTSWWRTDVMSSTCSTGLFFNQSHWNIDVVV